MLKSTLQNQTMVIKVLQVLVPLEAGTFFIGALLHGDVQIPLGFITLTEPPIFDAVIVESLCGLFLAVGAYAVWTRPRWAWPMVTTAHVVAVAGVLLGIGALTVGAGPSTMLNTVYHRTILVVLVSVLALLWTPLARSALRHGDEVARKE